MTDAAVIWPSLCTWGPADPEKSVNLTKFTQLLCSRSRNQKGGLVTHSPHLEKVVPCENFPRSSRALKCGVGAVGSNPALPPKCHISWASFLRLGADIAPERNAGHFLTRQKMRGSDLPDTRGPYSTQETWSPRGAGKEETAEHMVSAGLSLVSCTCPFPPSFHLLPYFRPVFCPSLSLPSSLPSSPWVSQSLSVFISASVSVFPTSRLLARFLPLLLPSSHLSQPLLQAQTQSLPGQSTPTPRSRAGRGVWGALTSSMENVCTAWGHSCAWGALCSGLSLAKPVPEESSLGPTHQRPGTAKIRTAVWENQLTCSHPLFHSYISFVTLGKSPNYSELCFPYVQNQNSNTHLIAFFEDSVQSNKHVPSDCNVPGTVLVAEETKNGLNTCSKLKATGRNWHLNDIYSSRTKNAKERYMKMHYGNKEEYVMSSDWEEGRDFSEVCCKIELQ